MLLIYVIILLIIYYFIRNHIFKKVFINANKKAVLITGSGSGLGYSLAIRLNEMGFKVYATVRRPGSEGAKQLSECCKYSDKMVVLEMDVTNEEHIDSCFDKIKADLDKDGHQLWAVVNNAGYSAPGQFEWGTLDEIRKIFNINVFGVVFVTRKFIPLLRYSQGRIVNVSSLAGRITSENLTTYSMSKHSITALTDGLRIEMRKFKIKVASIEPGTFKTQMVDTSAQQIERIWSETDASIREVYGERYYRSKRNLVRYIMKASETSQDLSIVVDDMIDAVINVKPKRYYRQSGLMFQKIVSAIGPLLPQFVLDQFFYYYDIIPPQFTIDTSSIKY